MIFNCVKTYNNSSRYVGKRRTPPGNAIWYCWSPLQEKRTTHCQFILEDSILVELLVTVPCTRYTIYVNMLLHVQRVWRNGDISLLESYGDSTSTVGPRHQGCCWRSRDSACTASHRNQYYCKRFRDSACTASHRDQCCCWSFGYSGCTASEQHHCCCWRFGDSACTASHRHK